MKRAASAAVALVAFVVAPPAGADVPEWKDLPSGHVTSPPEGSFPASIGAKEKVPGFVFGRADHTKRADDLVLSTNEEVACFSASRRSLTEEEASNDDAFPDWREGLAAATRIDAKGGVTAVHREEVIEDGSGARLETVDAWVDPKTAGVRRFATATLPLALVASAVGELKIYAAREERDGRNIVQLVVVPKRRKETASFGTLLAMLESGESVTSSGCGHLRVALSAAKVGGDAAVMTATVILPSKDDGATEGGEKILRMRDASIQASVSQTKSDVDPVVSVSLGWATRETTQRAGGEPGDRF